MRHSFILYLLVIVVLSSCKKEFFKPEPAKDKESIFEYLHKTFVESYGPTNERNINWNALYNTYRPQVSNNMSDDQFHTVVTSMLANLNDGHVSLTSPGRSVFNSNTILNNKIDDKLFNTDVIKSNYLSDIKSGEGYFYGKIKNKDVGYISFEYVAENLFVFTDFLDANTSSLGIIIDMRHNSGGDFTYSFSSMGRLTQEERFIFKSRTKNGPNTDDFTEWYNWNFSPKGNYFNKPIILLTDRYTISAGERTVMALQALPNVITIGDTTCGAQATMIGRELANGWYFTIATQNTLLHDGKSYEGIGLAPDVYFKNNLSDINQGIDKTLQKAIDEL